MFQIFVWVAEKWITDYFNDFHLKNFEQKHTHYQASLLELLGKVGGGEEEEPDADEVLSPKIIK